MGRRNSSLFTDQFPSSNTKYIIQISKFIFFLNFHPFFSPVCFFSFSEENIAKDLILVVIYLHSYLTQNKCSQNLVSAAQITKSPTHTTSADFRTLDWQRILEHKKWLPKTIKYFYDTMPERFIIFKYLKHILY